jgi:exodeoxyribonuclease III
MQILTLFLALLVGLALGGLLGLLWARSRATFTEGMVDQAEVMQGLDRLQDQMRDLEHQRSTWQGQLHQQVQDMRFSTEALRAAATTWQQHQPDLPTALTGDWNIAPTDEDVWDIAQFAKSTHVTPPERAAFQAMVDAGFADVVRPHTPGPEVYTYWDYYRQRYERNKGMRIDFVLGSPALQARVTHAFIDREERAGKGASDHAPLVVELS